MKKIFLYMTPEAETTTLQLFRLFIWGNKNSSMPREEAQKQNQKSADKLRKKNPAMCMTHTVLCKQI